MLIRPIPDFFDQLKEKVEKKLNMANTPGEIAAYNNCLHVLDTIQHNYKKGQDISWDLHNLFDNSTVKTILTELVNNALKSEAANESTAVASFLEDNSQRVGIKKDNSKALSDLPGLLNIPDTSHKIFSEAIDRATKNILEEIRMNLGTNDDSILELFEEQKKALIDLAKKIQQQLAFVAQEMQMNPNELRDFYKNSSTHAYIYLLAEIKNIANPSLHQSLINCLHKELENLAISEASLQFNGKFLETKAPNNNAAIMKTIFAIAKAEGKATIIGEAIPKEKAIQRLQREKLMDEKPAIDSPPSSNLSSLDESTLSPSNIQRSKPNSPFADYLKTHDFKGALGSQASYKTKENEILEDKEDVTPKRPGTN